MNTFFKMDLNEKSINHYTQFERQRSKFTKLDRSNIKLGDDTIFELKRNFLHDENEEDCSRTEAIDINNSVPEAVANGLRVGQVLDTMNCSVFNYSIITTSTKKSAFTGIKTTFNNKRIDYGEGHMDNCIKSMDKILVVIKKLLEESKIYKSQEGGYDMIFTIGMYLLPIAIKISKYFEEFDNIYMEINQYKNHVPALKERLNHYQLKYDLVWEEFITTIWLDDEFITKTMSLAGRNFQLLSLYPNEYLRRAVKQDFFSGFKNDKTYENYLIRKEWEKLNYFSRGVLDTLSFEHVWKSNVPTGKVSVNVREEIFSCESSQVILQHFAMELKKCFGAYTTVLNARSSKPNQKHAAPIPLMMKVIDTIIKYSMNFETGEVLVGLNGYVQHWIFNHFNVVCCMIEILKWAKSMKVQYSQERHVLKKKHRNKQLMNFIFRFEEEEEFMNKKIFEESLLNNRWRHVNSLLQQIELFCLNLRENLNLSVYKGDKIQTPNQKILEKLLKRLDQNVSTHQKQYYQVFNFWSGSNDTDETSKANYKTDYDDCMYNNRPNPFSSSDASIELEGSKTKSHRKRDFISRFFGKN
ncbi:uncharacterized protein NDAI_0J01590 [Naumovozyma dairenensis CBS 421]|uniref:Uncharacterized protein n=1 Tax=Naumovozyma dairenensis (strain ATCC 10597 / BCRC 20456 / CBS 421 / NBRC 0211 / NRRL Y-12639) TaxID=1071378 RepID=G0WGX3_NAUDC|nr:hypothetical protein NDAI_0J01590 [Naumovozyma dairenensis CBS 421]CCD27051.1 hypothetical protein NDAI_0J01590 [Naumovozyma dairenensis CBS 421]